MYCSDFLCTYKSHSDEDSEDIYRAQFLQAFGINKWDDEIIENKTKDLYTIVSKCKDLDIILNKIKISEKYTQFIKIIGNNDYDIFKLLFMFDLFDLSHKCFCDIIHTQNIKLINKTNIINNI